MRERCIRNLSHTMLEAEAEPTSKNVEEYAHLGTKMRSSIYNDESICCTHKFSGAFDKPMSLTMSYSLPRFQQSWSRGHIGKMDEIGSGKRVCCHWYCSGWRGERNLDRSTSNKWARVAISTHLHCGSGVGKLFGLSPGSALLAAEVTT